MLAFQPQYVLSAGGVWTPSNSTASIFAWYDADDATTITDTSGSVDQWDDKAGTNDLTATSTARPTTGTTTFAGGLNAIDFDGTANFMRKTGATDLGSGNNPIFIIGVAVLRTGYTGNGVVYSYDCGTSSGAGDTFAASQQNNSANLELTARYENGYAESDTTYSNGDEVLWSHALDGGNYGSTQWYINATSTGPTTNFANRRLSFTAGSKNITIGADFTGDGFADIAMGEILFLDVVPTTAEREEFEGYLAHKWGLEGNLPGGHTYKSAPPTT